MARDYTGAFKKEPDLTSVSVKLQISKQSNHQNFLKVISKTFHQTKFCNMMNIACSTCLESFTSGCDISTTPCGHVFHTGCLTRWLNVNTDCPQCRKGCEIRQIIKLFFTESQSAIEENITKNELERLELELKEKTQKWISNISELETELTQANQKCNNLEREKLLMKLDWSKTEWNLKESLKESKQTNQ